MVGAAYKGSSEQSLRLFQVRAHKVRALASSWALFNCDDFNNIMSASFWRGQTTFTDFYLRSLAMHTDGLYLLGPIVAAQSIVIPSA